MCGIFGVYGHAEAANLAYLGLHALQHRGQESAGIVSAQQGKLYSARGMGRVGEMFDEKTLARVPGSTAIGHVRYSTAGSSELRNAQPFEVQYQHGSLAIAHNGNLVNALELRRTLERTGSIFVTNSDTEVIVHLLAKEVGGDTPERLVRALSQVEGAYSALLLTESKLIAVRDPNGFRPLAMGRIKDAIVFASETCAFDLIEAEFIRELEPGEIVVVDQHGMRSLKPFQPTTPKFCVFEHVYFARPDSIVNGTSVYRTREAMGRALAREHPVEADIVIPVPDSGVPASIGYARESGIPYDMGLIRSHYVGRTFIEPQQSIRHFGVKLKLNAVREVLQGKRVIAIDDSIVRGTTSRKIVKMIKAAGAREVHMRISSPPVTHPCYYGIDTPTRSELIGASHTTDEIARYITADSLAYLSREGLMRAVGAEGGRGFCDACFTGNYAVGFKQDGEVVPEERLRESGRLSGEHAPSPANPTGGEHLAS